MLCNRGRPLTFGKGLRAHTDGAAQARERGNALFRAGQYKEAAAEYSSALDALGSTADDKETRVALLKNRSACRLKLVRTGRPARHAAWGPTC